MKLIVGASQVSSYYSLPLLLLLSILFVFTGYCLGKQNKKKILTYCYWLLKFVLEQLQLSGQAAFQYGIKPQQLLASSLALHSCQFPRIMRGKYGILSNFLSHDGYLHYCHISRISGLSLLRNFELPFLQSTNMFYVKRPYIPSQTRQ